MSEHITHVAIFEDSTRIGLSTGRLPDSFHHVLDRHWELARFASASRSGDKYSIPLLKDLKQKWPARKSGDYVEEKLAFLLGWRTHQAADRRFKPVYRQLQPEHYAREANPDTSAPSDVSVLHDAVVYREVYGNGEYAPYPPGLLEDRMTSFAACKTLDAAATLDLFGSVFQKSLLDLQPASQSPEAVPKVFQKFYVNLQRYSEKWAAPDPRETLAYIYGPNFYNPSDPLIRTARALQRKQPPPSISFDQSYEEAKTGSQYAQALRLGVKYLLAAGDFWAGRIDEKQLHVLFDLGKSHLQGGSD
ncbi:MAG: hypothetical protein ACKV22_34410 [Bryobacteraceae bacterium]